MRVHTTAVKVKKSGTLKRELKAACHQLQLPYYALKPAQATRWNSTLTNINSGLQMQPALELVYNNPDASDVWLDLEISEREWRLLRGISTVLEKVLVFTKIFETETKPTSNLVIRKLYDLKKTMESHENDANNPR